MVQSMEYVISDKMQRLFDNFTSLAGVRIAFISLDGRELCVGNNLSICSYCSMRRRSHVFEEACCDEDQCVRDLSLEAGELHFYQCHAGLCEAIMPVCIAEAPIGYIMIGQFRVAGIPIEARNKQELHELEKLPEFSREKSDDLLEIFKVVVQHIAINALVRRKDLDVLGPLIERMRKDPAEALSLSEAARFVELSSSRLSHLFRSRVGINFKRYQIMQRLDLADRLLKTNPGWGVARIAKESGFEDPLYFSRVYKERRGIPPSKALKALA